MDLRVDARAAALAARTARRILIAGCTAEPVAILDAVMAEPELWQGKTLTGAFIPGVNNRDFSALGQNTSVETIFTTAGLGRQAKGRVAHLPLHYSSFWDRLSRPGVVDLVLMTVPPPRDDGSVGYGLACDFSPAAIQAGARLIGVVNPAMPDIMDGPRVPLARFEALVEADSPLPQLSAVAPDAANQAIARSVLERIPENGTLQLGLGKLQTAILEAVLESGRADLGFHAGMISDGVLDVLEAGGFRRGVTTGVGLGSGQLYEKLRKDVGIRWRPVGETHSQIALSAISNLVSVNSVMQVDLAGQANAEFLGGRQVSGHGGMVDFVRGSRSSCGGLSILALPARAANGQSRIVPALSAGTPVSVARSDVDLVITEFGIADLREASLDQRADRLLAISAPEFRDALADEWRKFRT